MSQNEISQISHVGLLKKWERCDVMAPFVKRPLPRAAAVCYECRMTQMLPGGLTDDTPMANPLNCTEVHWRTLSLRCSFSYHLVMTPQFATSERVGLVVRRF